ncbi:hypothetical protein QE429_000642 [Bacillus sp. SORGH_AS 510]|uniref:hypothetical protein n=1 Tax=Bacillus sp. SORGH_AS_0510 TaxID=3041771 RepID=UPI00278097FE|nr:hypothetical protein [Bacillus sp. SORGH_AS_0510]MDQ1143815.1 hypothetical protein [Bacillus sp. SORGH_AS_0510]
MKKLNYLIVFIGIISLFAAGCNGVTKNEEQYIKVEKRVENEDKYEDFKKITANTKVQKVKDIIENSDWENAKVSMVRPPDYRFVFQFKNPEIKAKAVLYELWISPKKDQVELVIDAQSKYIQLDKKKSASLIKILTSEK